MTQGSTVTERDMEGVVEGGVYEIAACGEGWVGGACVWAVGRLSGLSVRETLNSL